MKQTNVTKDRTPPTTKRNLLDDLDEASTIPQSVLVDAYPFDPILQYIITPIFHHYYSFLLAVAVSVVISIPLCPLRYQAETCNGTIWDFSFFWFPISIGLMHLYAYVLKFRLQRSRVAT